MCARNECDSRNRTRTKKTNNYVHIHALPKCVTPLSGFMCFVLILVFTLSLVSDVSPFSRKVLYVNFISPRIRNSKYKVLSSGCCSPTLSCHRQLNLYPKFLHISHRENGSFEVLSLQFINVLVLSSPTWQLSFDTSRTSHVSSRAALWSNSSFPFLPCPIVVVRFSLSLVYTFLTFRRDLLRMKQHWHLINHFDTARHKQVSNNARAGGTWSSCRRLVSPPSCINMSTVVTKTIDSAYVLGLSRCLTIQT